MKARYVVATIVSLLLVVFFVGGTLLPKTYEASRQAAFCHSAEVVFTTLDRTEHIASWSIFSTDARMSSTRDGEAGVGARVRWGDLEDESIRLEITRSEPFEHVGYHLDFAGDFDLDVLATIEVSGGGDARVTLTTVNEPASLTGRWLLYLMHNVADAGQLEGVQDALDVQLEKLSEHLTGTRGACEPGPEMVPGTV
jgi:hypothetical protein